MAEPTFMQQLLGAGIGLGGQLLLNSQNNNDRVHSQKDLERMASLQAKLGREATDWSMYRGLPKQITPYGTQFFNIDTNTLTRQLTPQEQAIFDQGQRGRFGFGQLGLSQMARLSNILNSPFDTRGLTPRGDVRKVPLPQLHSASEYFSGMNPARQDIYDAAIGNYLAGRPLPTATQGDQATSRLSDYDRQMPTVREIPEGGGPPVFPVTTGGGESGGGGLTHGGDQATSRLSDYDRQMAAFAQLPTGREIPEAGGPPVFPVMAGQSGGTSNGGGGGESFLNSLLNFATTPAGIKFLTGLVNQPAIPVPTPRPDPSALVNQPAIPVPTPLPDPSALVNQPAIPVPTPRPDPVDTPGTGSPTGHPELIAQRTEFDTPGTGTGAVNTPSGTQVASLDTVIGLPQSVSVGTPGTSGQGRFSPQEWNRLALLEQARLEEEQKRQDRLASEGFNQPDIGNNVPTSVTYPVAPPVPTQSKPQLPAGFPWSLSPKVAQAIRDSMTPVPDGGLLDSLNPDNSRPVPTPRPDPVDTPGTGSPTGHPELIAQRTEFDTPGTSGQGRFSPQEWNRLALIEKARLEEEQKRQDRLASEGFNQPDIGNNVPTSVTYPVAPQPVVTPVPDGSRPVAPYPVAPRPTRPVQPQQPAKGLTGGLIDSLNPGGSWPVAPQPVVTPVPDGSRPVAPYPVAPRPTRPVQPAKGLTGGLIGSLNPDGSWPDPVADTSGTFKPSVELDADGQPISGVGTLTDGGTPRVEDEDGYIELEEAEIPSQPVTGTYDEAIGNRKPYDAQTQAGINTFAAPFDPGSGAGRTGHPGFNKRGSPILTTPAGIAWKQSQDELSNLGRKLAYIERGQLPLDQYRGREPDDPRQRQLGVNIDQAEYDRMLTEMGFPPGQREQTVEQVDGVYRLIEQGVQPMERMQASDPRAGYDRTGAVSQSSPTSQYGPLGQLPASGPITGRFTQPKGLLSQIGDAGPIQGSVVTPEGITRDLSDGANYQTAYENQIFAPLEKRLMRERKIEESTLYRQGIRPDSALWKINENAFNRRLDNARLSARREALQESIIRGQFRNQAQQQAFQQALSSGQFGRESQAQRFGQQATRGQFSNQAQQQAFQQAVSSGQFGNKAQQQAFQQALNRGLFGLQGQGQGEAQDAARAESARKSQQGDFARQMGMVEMDTRIAQQNLANRLAQQRGLTGQRAGELQELGQVRNVPLNEIFSLMERAQVNQPEFAQTPQVTHNAPDLAGIQTGIDTRNQYWAARRDRYNRDNWGAFGAIAQGIGGGWGLGNWGRGWKPPV